MAPLIEAQLSIVREKEVHNDPKALAKCPNKPMPITLNTAALYIVPHIPTKTSSFSLNVPCLPPPPEYQQNLY
ncbi:uncharacterized protein G2W53_014563 [Senna tora]|uniref:Uncharacterized protein n=1 Tax=Senna tora TaxID=362788 RepID=A0A835C5W3_9FABA|nr:uncharacterized protein G2W53_014563 [Senna tora]